MRHFVWLDLGIANPGAAYVIACCLQPSLSRLVLREDCRATLERAVSGNDSQPAEYRL